MSCVTIVTSQPGYSKVRELTRPEWSVKVTAEDGTTLSGPCTYTDLEQARTDAEAVGGYVVPLFVW